MAVPKASCDLGRPAPAPPPAHVTSSFRCSPPRPGSHEHRTRAGQEVLRVGHKRQVPTYSKPDNPRVCSRAARGDASEPDLSFPVQHPGCVCA